uniref:Secreted protein n=1 Tax=Panagrellus redivivus TaxID=6233 RepID=A0A7E4V4B0_PANRE
MPSKTVIFVTVFLTALTTANAILCNVDTKGDDTECPSNYCFISVSADKDLKAIKKCADAVPEHKKHEVNTWINSGGSYIFVCDENNCNSARSNIMDNLKEVTEGNLVCQYNKKARGNGRDAGDWSLKSCTQIGVNARCAYTKNLETNETWQDCMIYLGDAEVVLNTKKCVKTETEYSYICNTTLCNNAHVCDQLELGKPSPFDQPPPGPAPGPGQSPPAPGPVPAPAVSTPKNIGSIFNLPTIVMSVLVIGICFTVR